MSATLEQTIVTICAWHEPTPPPQVGVIVSHGICEPCRARVMAESRREYPACKECGAGWQWEAINPFVDATLPCGHGWGSYGKVRGEATGEDTRATTGVRNARLEA